MKSLNKVEIIWNITNDLVLKELWKDKKVISFWVATNWKRKTESWDYEDTVEFHNIIFWNKPAEIIKEYCKKWQKIYIEWRLQTSNWEDKETWIKKYKTDIIWNEFILLSSKDKKQDVKL